MRGAAYLIQCKSIIFFYTTKQNVCLIVFSSLTLCNFFVCLITGVC